VAETKPEGVPAKTLATLLDMGEEEVVKIAAKGIFVKSGRGQYLLAPSVRNYVRNLREVAAGRQGEELNAVDENARLKIVMRRNYELKNAALEGSMMSTDEVVDAWSSIVRTIKGMMLSIPSRIQEKLPHLPFDDVEAIRKVAHKALAETSKVTPEAPPIPSPALD
jgi:phage terminase Nu1 subunit (DNA packaging protein)